MFLLEAMKCFCSVFSSVQHQLNFLVVCICCCIQEEIQQLVISNFCVRRVDAIDPALRRSGRFDAKVEVTTPTEEERLQILKVSMSLLNL